MAPSYISHSFYVHLEFRFDLQYEPGPNMIQWCDSFEYLGVTFHAGLKLKTNIEVIEVFNGIKQCAR